MDSEYEIGYKNNEANNRSSVIENNSNHDILIIKSSSNCGTDSPNENSSLLHSKMKINLTKVREVFAQRSALVDILAMFFGVGTWIGINSTYVQLPLLVNVLPEGWSLASFIVIIIQVANIGPVLYTLVQKFSSVKDCYIIYVLLLIGVAASVNMAFFYPETAYIFGAERSYAIFSIVFFFALVGCTSSVLFMPYMGRFRDIYLITYLIGEGLSGFLPGVIALVQGVGGNAECIPNNSTEPGAPKFLPFTPAPRFSTQTFFLIIFGIFCASFIAFVLLDRLRSVKTEYASVVISNGNNYQYNTSKVEEKAEQVGDQLKQDQLPQVEVVQEEFKKLSDKNYRALLVLLGVICMFANAIFPSIMTYGTLPYGNIAYHLAATLSSIANPIACFLAVFLTKTSIRNIVCLSIIAIPFAIYSMTTAVMSPNPPLMDNVMGEILVITSWTFLIGLASYIRLKITTIFRYQGGKSLVWVGAWTQIGSFVGAILSFGVVNYTSVFVSYFPCSS